MEVIRQKPQIKFIETGQKSKLFVFLSKTTKKTTKKRQKDRPINKRAKKWKKKRAMGD